ncbi:hypothetical protein D3C72_1840800 [compost metagenome]
MQQGGCVIGMRLDLDPATDAVGRADIADFHQVFRQGVGIQQRCGHPGGFGGLESLTLRALRPVQRPLLAFSHVRNKERALAGTL